MWSQCAWVINSESLIGFAPNSLCKALQRGRMTDTATSTMISPSERSSTQVVLNITNRINSDDCSINERSFATEISFLNKFLRVIPCGPARCHRDGDE